MKPDLALVEGVPPPQTSLLLPGERVRYFGPACMCGGRDTRFVGPGVRDCPKCGQVEFRITSDGYRGVRVIGPREASAGASPQGRPGPARVRSRQR